MRIRAMSWAVGFACCFAMSLAEVASQSPDVADPFSLSGAAPAIGGTVGGPTGSAPGVERPTVGSPIGTPPAVTAIDSGVPESGVPERGVPERGVPERGVPERGAGAAGGTTTAAAPSSRDAEVPTPADRIAALLESSSLDEPAAPLSLLQAVGSEPQASRRVLILHRYWDVAERLARHSIEQKRLAALRDKAPEAYLPRAFVVTATHDREVAELALTEARIALAETLEIAAGAPLPLPTDIPHTGKVDTRFETIVATRTLSPQAHHINRSLPIGLEIIAKRNDACLAADVYVDLLTSRFSQGAVSFEQWVAGIETLRRQELALVEAVFRYNRDIADYVCEVVGPGVQGKRFVGALIPVPVTPEPVPAAEAGALQRAPARSPSAYGAQFPGRVAPAGFYPSLIASGVRPPTPSAGSATDADPAIGRDQIGIPAPKTVPGQRAGQNLQGAPVVGSGTSASPPAAFDLILPVPPGDLPSPADPSSQPEPMPFSAGGPTDVYFTNYLQVGGCSDVPLESSSCGPPVICVDPCCRPVEEAVECTVFRATVEQGEAVASGPQDPAAWSSEPATPRQGREDPLFDAFAEDPLERMAGVLFDIEKTPPSFGSYPADGLALADCVGGAPPHDRVAAVTAYWRCAECLAVRSYLLRETLALEERLSESESASKIRRLPLTIVRLATEAEAMDARIELFAAQLDLTTRLGRAAGSTWYVPATAPATTRLDVNVDVMPESIAATWAVRRAAISLPQMHEALARQASGLLEMNTIRDAAQARYRSGAVAGAELAEVIERQKRHTRDLLRGVADYNVAVADYVLATQPSWTPAGDLAEALLCRR